MGVGESPRHDDVLSDAGRQLAAAAGTLDSIVAASADTVFFMDRSGTIRYLRSQVVDLLTLDRGEPDGGSEETTDRELLRWIHRDDRDEVRRVYTEALAAERGEMFAVTHRIMIKDGTWVWTEVRIVNQFGLEGVDALVVSARDITARVLAEQRLRRRLAAEELLASLAPRFVDVSAADLDDALLDALGEIGRFCGVDRAWILRFDRDLGTVHQTHEWCGEGILPQAHELRGLRLADLPSFSEWTEGGDSLIVPSVADMPESQAAERVLLELQDIKSLAAHTILQGGELDGLVGLDAVRGTQAFDRADLWLLAAVAPVFGAAFRRCAAEKALAASEERFRAMIHNATDGVRLLDDRLRTVWASPAVASITGHTSELVDPDERLGLVHPDDRHRVAVAQVEVLDRAGAVTTCSYRCRHADGHWVDIEEVMTNLLHDPAVEGVVANMRDVTADRRHEAELMAQARRDPLTDLPNRRQFDELVDAALARVERTGARLALLYLDLDRFKLVNDSFGHSVGDSLLVQAADRLCVAVRSGDVVARLSGDEFVILCEPIDDEGEALSMADRIVAAFREPFLVGTGTIYSTASVGVVISRPDASDRPGLLRDADAAMYSAKAAGRNRAALFSGTLVAMARERVQVEVGLRGAVPEHQLRLRYQPIVSLMTGELTGSEALLRWHHPERGELSPDVFLDVAEETGIIVPIGEWVVHEACRQLAEWDRDGLGGHLDLHVNVSVRQLVEGGIADTVQRALHESNIEPSRLCVEITESALLAGDDATSELKAVRACGVRLALDDFGTGHSSLSYLRHLDLDMLKVDRSFVDGVGHDEHDTAIVTAIVRLAESLGLATVGEGIESVEQRDHLAAIGCTQGQGFWCAPPLHPNAFAALVRSADSGDPSGR